MIDLGLSGKRALVAGAGDIPTRAGIGRRTAVRLAEAGATVACLDMSQERAAGTADVIVAAGVGRFRSSPMSRTRRMSSVRSMKRSPRWAQ